MLNAKQSRRPNGLVLICQALWQAFFWLSSPVLEEPTLADKTGVRSRYEAQHELGLVVCDFSSVFVALAWALTLDAFDEVELVYDVRSHPTPKNPQF